MEHMDKMKIQELKNPQRIEGSSSIYLTRAKELATQTGLDWNKLTENTKERFVKMADVGHLESSENMNQLAKKILERPDIAAMKTIILQNVMQGSTLSDIGKTGPRGVTETQSNFIAEIFKIRGVKNPEKIKVAEFVDNRLSHFETPEKRMILLKSLERYIPPHMTMREFYNLHTEWSLEIIGKEKIISQKVKDIVARHHTLDREKNPDDELTPEDKLVILLDQYDARRIRGGENHENTLAWIEEKIKNNGFGEDEEFSILLKAFKEIAPSVPAYR